MKEIDTVQGYLLLLVLAIHSLDSFFGQFAGRLSLFVVNTGETTGFPLQQWQTPGLSWMLE